MYILLEINIYIYYKIFIFTYFPLFKLNQKKDLNLQFLKKHNTANLNDINKSKKFIRSLLFDQYILG